MNSKRGFCHRPGTLQASQLNFALIQFHLNEFENMMLLILEQLLLNLFSINKVVLKKTFSISFGLNTIEKSFQDMLSSKNQWREKPISFFLKTRLKKLSVSKATQMQPKSHILTLKKDDGLLNFYTRLTITKNTSKDLKLEEIIGIQKPKENVRK